MNTLVDTNKLSGTIKKIVTDIRLITGATSFIVSLLACASIVDTVYQTPPVTELSSAVVLNETSITLTRYLQRNNNYPVTFNDFLVNVAGDKAVQLSESTYPKQLAVSRAFPIPANIKGKWCMHGYMKYRYRLAWSDHIEELKPICMDFGSDEGPH